MDTIRWREVRTERQFYSKNLVIPPGGIALMSHCGGVKIRCGSYEVTHMLLRRVKGLTHALNAPVQFVLNLFLPDATAMWISRFKEAGFNEVPWFISFEVMYANQTDVVDTRVLPRYGYAAVIQPVDGGMLLHCNSCETSWELIARELPVQVHNGTNTVLFLPLRRRTPDKGLKGVKKALEAVGLVIYESTSAPWLPR